MANEQVLLNEPKFKFKESFGFCSNITRISDDSITIHIPHKNAIDVPLYHNDEGYYFFVEREYFPKSIAFSDSNNNIYGVFLKEVNSWIIADFPFYSVNGVQSYLDLYYKHNPVIAFNVDLEVVQGEIVESAEQVHNRICDNFAIVEKTLYEICVDLKSIRDNKHYKTLGYNTFEDYCLENFNLNRRTVYRYISVAENLSNDFVTSMSQNGVGVTKLDIISRLTDEERSELIQTTDIENTPVKQLEQKSREIKENREVQVKENDVVSNVVELNKPTGHLTFKDICLIFDFDSYKPYFVTYDNVDVDNNLVSNYNYLVRTFKKFLNKDYSFNDDIFNSLSDLLEISKRFADGLYDFKQYLKKEKNKDSK